MKASTTRVAETHPLAVSCYKDMRAALLDLPDSERRICEIVVTAQLAALGHEVPFKLHAMRLFTLGVSKTQLEQIVLAGLGVTLLMPQAAQVLDWIESADTEFRAQAPRPN